MVPFYSATAVAFCSAVDRAGAAGLAAARELLDPGLRVIVLEARDRIGGRAHTDMSVFGVPYDQGCHWLHNGVDRPNPFIQYGQGNGFDIFPQPFAAGSWSLYVGSRLAVPQEQQAYFDTWDAVNNAISTAGAQGNDISAAAAVANAGANTGPWYPLVAYEIGAALMAKDLEDFSCVDWWNSEEFGTNWLCSEGFGALVAHYGRNLPVQLNTPVTRVRWGDDCVSVETPRGTIRTAAVIVTVSTGVLAGGGIVFDPPLPIWKQEAFERISLGVYNHIALQFSQDVFGVGNDSFISHQNANDQTAQFSVNISGSGLTFGGVGGRFAQDLEQAGVATAVDFGLQELRNIFGSNIDTHFVKGYYTRWGEDQWARGSYTSAEPGYAHMRERLKEPIAEKIFFAGEACELGQWATCAGAYFSGLEAVRTMAELARPPWSTNPCRAPIPRSAWTVQRASRLPGFWERRY